MTPTQWFALVGLPLALLVFAIVSVRIYEWLHVLPAADTGVSQTGSIFTISAGPYQPAQMFAGDDEKRRASPGQQYGGVPPQGQR